MQGHARCPLQPHNCTYDLWDITPGLSRNYVQRPVIPRMNASESYSFWKRGGLDEHSALVVDTTMCFQSRGSVRSITLWSTGWMQATFFIVRPLQYDKTCDFASSFQIIAASRSQKLRIRHIGMIRIEDDNLKFEEGDCLAWNGTGIAMTFGPPRHRGSCRESPKVSVVKGYGAVLPSVGRTMHVHGILWLAASLRIELLLANNSWPGHVITPRMNEPLEGQLCRAVSPKLRRHTVAIVVRSYAGEFDLLTELLLSCEWFVPLSWPINVVLDEDEPDRIAFEIGSLPPWAHVHFQAIPEFVQGISAILFQKVGFFTAMWTHFWADNYTSAAEFVVIPDGDSIFHTVGLERLLFHEGKPVIWAQTLGPSHFGTADALGLPWVGEFMSYLPFVIHAGHLPLLRDFIRQQFHAASFDQAFALLARVHARWEAPLSVQSIAGHYLYHYHRGDYHWSVMLPKTGGNLDWKAEETCPAMRVATHLKYWEKSQWHVATPPSRQQLPRIARTIIHRALCVAVGAWNRHAHGVSGSVDHGLAALVNNCSAWVSLERWMMMIYFSWQTDFLSGAHHRPDYEHCKPKKALVDEHLFHMALTVQDRVRERKERLLSLTSTMPR